jgi:hypothetical protein
MPHSRARTAGWQSRIGSAFRSLFLSGLAAGLLWPLGADAQLVSPPPIPTGARYGAFVAEASRRFGIPEAWIRAVMRSESGGDLNATSPKGAMGLMQVMPATWTELRGKHGFGLDPYDARESILAGAAYLREMFDRYGAPAFLAAYNAGPKRYEQYRDLGRPLPAETVAYVAVVAPAIGMQPLEQAPAAALPDPLEWTRSALFIRRAGDGSNAPVPQSGDTFTAPPLLVAERSAGSLITPRDTIFVARLGSPAPR